MASMEEVEMEVDDNCTMWGLNWTMSCIQADLEDTYLNPWLHPVDPSRYWGEGVLLPALALSALVSNCLLVRLLVCRLVRPGDWLLTLLSLSSSLLLLSLTLARTPPALSCPLLPPLALPYLAVLERSLTTLTTFLFIIFVGDRHLRQVEHQSYSWLKPLLFSLAVAILSSLPLLWELRVTSLPRQQIEQVIGLSMTPELEGQVEVLEEQVEVLEEQVEVLRRTPLWHFPVYRNLVRYLLALLTSQVATVWLLPVILLHSRDMGKTLSKARRLRRGGRASDPLLPVLCGLYILLSLPTLADLVIQILLMQTPAVLHIVSSISLVLLLLLLPLLVLLLEPDLRRRFTSCTSCASCSCTSPCHQMVPTEEF